ncbi:MAG: ThiF family adenylyltransferase, partial [Actinomycetota bacterium]|nr:ThiF family adenylyltransferase [Actinomycetota bacterium]
MPSRSPRPVRVLDPSRTRVVVFGVGGTGSYVVGQLARLLYGLKEIRRETGLPNDRDRPCPGPARRAYGDAARSLVPGVLLVDGDRVSHGNLLRQYYLPPDVGRPKAAVSAKRYAAAYGLSIGALPRYLTPETDLKEFVPEGSIVVSCVDNSKTRKILHEGLKRYHHVVYVDAGNAA